MKILIAHNRYQQSGGEDAVVQQEKGLLQTQGHIVKLYLVDNDSLTSLPEKIKVAFQAPYSQKSKKSFLACLKKFQPQIVHIHNFFPILTPAIYDACIAMGIPVVQTLHNYRTICPGALLMREGKVCEICIRQSPFKSVLHRCYRNSFIGTFAVARMVAYHRRNQTWENKVNRFIALTRFGKMKFVEAGFPPEKISVKPNFCNIKIPKKTNEEKSRKGCLFVGRLSREKGLRTLMAAWENLKLPLRIAGDGPLIDQIKDANLSNVSILGTLSPEQVSMEMSNAAFLVMPSEWYEGFPMVLVEAFAHGLPVIASRLGAMAEIVEDGRTGLHFDPGCSEDLAQKVEWLEAHPEECRQMGENALQVYEEKYTPTKNYSTLQDIYNEVIEEKKKSLKRKL